MKQVGIPQGKYRYFKTTYQAPFREIGELTLVSYETQKLAGLFLGNGIQVTKNPLLLEVVEVENGGEIPIFTQCELWLDRYFKGAQPEPAEISLALEGSAFAREVWEILCTIPYGEAISYGTIAKQIAKRRGLRKMSAQAVGHAVGANPIAIIIPCHRVVGSRNLGGYAYGLDCKRRLLRHEGFL